MKRNAILLIMAGTIITPLCRAAEPVFKFGLEWGFALTVHRYYYEYYYDTYGTILNTDSFSLLLGNGQIMGNAGVYFNDKMCASIHCGYMGIYKNRHMVPVLARFSFFPSGHEHNGLFCFADAGPAFCLARNVKSNGLCIICNAGGGYRLKMSDDISFDLLLSARASFDKPGIVSPYTGEYVPSKDIRKSVCNMYAVEFSVALNF